MFQTESCSGIYFKSDVGFTIILKKQGFWTIVWGGIGKVRPDPAAIGQSTFHLRPARARAGPGPPPGGTQRQTNPAAVML